MLQTLLLSEAEGRVWRPRIASDVPIEMCFQEVLILCHDLLQSRILILQTYHIMCKNSQQQRFMQILVYLTGSKDLLHQFLVHMRHGLPQLLPAPVASSLSSSAAPSFPFPPPSSPTPAASPAPLSSSSAPASASSLVLHRFAKKV